MPVKDLRDLYLHTVISFMLIVLECVHIMNNLNNCLVLISVDQLRSIAAIFIILIIEGQEMFCIVEDGWR